MIERYAAIISTLDGSLEPREGDEFLAWLHSQGFDADDSSAKGAAGEDSSIEADGSPDGGDDGAERTKNSDDAVGGGDGKAGDGAKRRAEVEAFLSAAAARLNTLVAEKEESLFGDRGRRNARARGRRWHKG